MSQATQQLAEKQFYHQLTEKQKSVIDAYARRPESTHTALLRMANAELEESGESITRSYVPVILNKYEQIAEEQRMKEQNNREEGAEKTVGTPTVQNVSSEREITISLTSDEISAMADDELPESIRLKMLRPFLK